MGAQIIDSAIFANMVKYGAGNLKKHAEEINNLNVFPIPDGDTGDNMLMTIMGGAGFEAKDDMTLAEAAKHMADGMLLSARGNSGVIFSQFFDGIAAGLEGLDTAGPCEMGIAFKKGVEHAYNAVMEPTEGTILTVVREATDYANSKEINSTDEYIEIFLKEAKRSLARTPELLPVLKKAGVVDSGGAGLIYIIEGMKKGLSGEAYDEENDIKLSGSSDTDIDINAFDENSVLEFGYCTELLLRLQTIKCNVEEFNVDTITDYLSEVGNSVVAFKTGSIIKLHVHTMTPQKVLDFCQQYGEFLKVKIENMSLQHNNIVAEGTSEEIIGSKDCTKFPSSKKDYGIVTVASGEGIKQTFMDMGSDIVVDGGQSMNPSAEDFLSAFDKVNAKTIFVFPNNGNIILAARQAASLYDKSEVFVLDSYTIGDCYGALSMLDFESKDAQEIVASMTAAMRDISTACVSPCIRKTTLDGIELHPGDYIGFAGKTILASAKNAESAAKETSDKMDFDSHEICIIVIGKDGSVEGADEIEKYVKQKHPFTEIYTINGQQNIYNYILIAE